MRRCRDAPPSRSWCEQRVVQYMPELVETTRQNRLRDVQTCCRSCHIFFLQQGIQCMQEADLQFSDAMNQVLAPKLPFEPTHHNGEGLQC